MAVTGTTSSTAGAVLTADEMLANAKKAAESSSSSGNKSKVQKLLEAHGDTGDTVVLSDVARQLAARDSTKVKTTSYKDQDWYLTAKVAQLKGQIALYSTLPGLDPSGGVMDSLTKEVNELVTKQQEKLKATTAEAKAKQDELAKAEAAKYQGVTSKDMLSRSKSLATTGKLPEDAVSADVQKLLDKLKVDTTA